MLLRLATKFSPDLIMALSDDKQYDDQEAKNILVMSWILNAMEDVQVPLVQDCKGVMRFRISSVCTQEK